MVAFVVDGVIEDVGPPKLNLGGSVVDGVVLPKVNFGGSADTDTAPKESLGASKLAGFEESEDGVEVPNEILGGSGLDSIGLDSVVLEPKENPMGLLSPGFVSEEAEVNVDPKLTVEGSFFS